MSTRKHRLVPAFSAVTFLIQAFLFQGCMATPNDAQTTPSNAKAPLSDSPVAAGAEAAALVSDLAYKYGFIALNSPKDFAALLKTDSGCTIAHEFTAALGAANLVTSVPIYCEALTAQGTAVRDCEAATTNAEQIALDVNELAKACATSAGSSTLAKSIVLTGVGYRFALGLSLPKKAAF